MGIFKKKNQMPQAPLPPTPVMEAQEEDFGLAGQQPYAPQQSYPQQPQPQQQQQAPQKTREQQAQEYDVQQFLANRIYQPENFAMSDIANLLWTIYRKLCDLERKQ